MPANLVLEKLCAACPEIRARLKAIEFIHGDMLAEAGTPIDRAIFPSSGLLSVVVALKHGDQIEVGTVGVDGAFGGASAFGARLHTSSALAQLPGRAWVISTGDLLERAKASNELRALMFAQEQRLLAQAQQTAACNARHTTTRRLCTWLLRAQEAAGSDKLLVTQESIARMLGVQRASVSVLAGQLQELDLIAYRRGRLQIKDAAGLTERACECYDAVKFRGERLMQQLDGAPQDFRCEPATGGSARM